MRFHLDTRAPDFEQVFADFASHKRASDSQVANLVQDIIADVQARGDLALADCARRFDRLDYGATPIRISKQEMIDALAHLTAEERAALELAAERIRVFHAAQRPDDRLYQDELGVTLGWRWTPLDSVGLYVPGGKAAYPSSVLMNALPAKVAGVTRIVMAVPAPDGLLNPLVLAAAHLAGVDEAYRMGGAQAVAALAYGTDSIAAVDKIVGPGNAYVAEAKRQVFGQVGIDSIAGPSEILVIADGANDPAWIAADLLSQAEHDEMAQAILVTPDAAFAKAVLAAIEVELKGLSRAAIAGESLARNGAVILTRSIDEAADLSNRLAPEHLELAVADPDALLPRIRHAGAIFLGRHAPEALGDYIAGPNHVLPTARAARYASGLGLLDFMKRSTIIGADPAALARLASHGITLAEAEGLPAHARSFAIRLNKR